MFSIDNLAISIVILAILLSAILSSVGVRSSGLIKLAGGGTDWREVAYFFLAMLAGVLLRELYNMLSKGTEFNFLSFSLAIVVSPLVFFRGLLPNLKGQSFDAFTLGLAIESGFFWNSIFDGIQPAT